VRKVSNDFAFKDKTATCQ